MKISSLLLLISLLLVSKLDFGQNVITDTTATVVSYWEKGDSANFTLIQTKEKYDNEKILSKGSSISKIEFSVTDVTPKSYIINWKYSEIKVNGNETQSPTVEKLIKLTQGINFKYRTSELGEFQELLNWEEVQSAVSKTINKLITETKDSKLAGIFEQTKNVFSSKESIEQIIMKDIQMLHGIYGGEYKLKQKISVDTELPNFLGGEPFPAILNIDMYELDQKQALCKIEISQTIDKDKAAKIISDWLNKADQSNNSNTNPINISDNTKYEIDLKKGWVKVLHHIRTSETNGLKTIETKEIKKMN